MMREPRKEWARSHLLKLPLLLALLLGLCGGALGCVFGSARPALHRQAAEPPAVRPPPSGVGADQTGQIGSERPELPGAVDQLHPSPPIGQAQGDAPPGAPPAGSAWAPGYWHWNGTAYDWIPGQWAPKNPSFLQPLP